MSGPTLSTGVLPGSVTLTRLRARTRATRRLALAGLLGAVCLLATAQILTERAPAGEPALPYAVVALGTFVLALPALALTQLVWGLRARKSAAFERELFVVPPRTRTLSRLGVAAGWAVVLLLGLTLPRLFGDSGLYGVAGPLANAAGPLALAGYAAGVVFTAWWARDVARALARARQAEDSPGDPWDPERGRRPARGRTLWAGAAGCAGALLAARAHLWDPSSPAVCVLALAGISGLVACTVVTDQ
ncbi:hypothetical protein [Streptosporangium sp. KLBMP 9127]|nr:hypothetical protein [Streptosporangium sp. KLBMP 9127]